MPPPRAIKPKPITASMPTWGAPVLGRVWRPCTWAAAVVGPSSVSAVVGGTIEVPSTVGPGVEVVVGATVVVVVEPTVVVVVEPTVVVVVEPTVVVVVASVVVVVGATVVVVVASVVVVEGATVVVVVVGHASPPILPAMKRPSLEYRWLLSMTGNTAPSVTKSTCQKQGGSSTEWTPRRNNVWWISFPTLRESAE